MGAKISVPFELAQRMYEAHQKGIGIDVIAIIGGCTEAMASAIIRHQHRLAMRTKYKTEAKPA